MLQKVPEPGEKRVYTTTVAPLLFRPVARPRGHRAKKAVVRAYTIGPDKRVYTIEPQTPKKEKKRVSTVVVYTCFFPANTDLEPF